MNMPNATRESASRMLSSLQTKAHALQRSVDANTLTADQLIDKAEVLVGLAILLEREARTTKIAQEILSKHGANVN